MKEHLVLTGCIQTLTSKTIQTRFFFINRDEGTVKDVTLELCNAIKDFNAKAQAILATGQYAMLIPYTYKNGMAKYSFGCGLSHYLQNDVLNEVVASSNKSLSFPLEDCYISMYTPSDVKSILKCKGVFDINIEEALVQRFRSKKIA